jgi:transposase-like protein DUF772
VCWCRSGVCTSGIRNAEGIFTTDRALFPGSLIRVSFPEQRDNIVGANVRMWPVADVTTFVTDVRFRGNCVAKLSLRRGVNRDFVRCGGDSRGRPMMGRQGEGQGQFFYEFDLDAVVPPDHVVRQIDTVLDLGWVHRELAPYYSPTGRPSIDPVLMIRMLIVGYAFAIRSERRLCSEVQVNLAYRWFCKLAIEDKIPDHSVFSRAP